MDYEVRDIKAKYKIIGRDARLDRAIDTALQVARTDLSVLIQGESGVGKEVLPRIIHDYSPRKTKTYLAVNCGSIPEGTIDSELFGHEKGSFTGAVAEHEGYFGSANGGTLFLDEVGELPLSTQARLLRVLETGEYIRVGGNKPLKTNVRIVAATNVNFQKAISEGRFREDLYFRLCTISIKMPPLRDRGDDVLTLFKKFSMDTCDRYSISEPLKLTPEAEMVMKSYKWPGNIRQLRNLAEQLNILHYRERLITPAMLAEHDVRPGSESMDLATVGGNTRDKESGYEAERPVIFAMINKLNRDMEELKQMMAQGGAVTSAMAGQLTPVGAPQLSQMSHTQYTQMGQTQLAPIGQPQISSQDSAGQVIGVGYPSHQDPSHFGAEMYPRTTIETHTSPYHKSQFEDVGETIEPEPMDPYGGNLSLASHEKRLIEEALRRNRFRRKLAANELGISERTLYRKIKEYDIEES